MVKWWIQKLQQNFKCEMYLKYMMHKPNITPFDTSKIIVFLIKLEWENIHGNVFSDTVFLKDTLIEIKGKFP